MKLLLYLILLTLGVGCVEGNGQSEREVSASSQPLSVRVSQVNGSSVSRSLNYVGVVEAQRSASLSFSVAGRVERLFFEEGQRIKVGDVVATLNAKELSELYSAAQAKLLQAQDAMLRLQKLYDSNTLAPIKYVEVQTALREAESMEAVAKKRLEDATLRSTIAGVVAQKSVNEGENVAPHQSVLSVVSIDNEVSVKISVGEDVISKIEVGMPLEVEVDQLGGERLQGCVGQRLVVANALTYTYDVKIKIANPRSQLLPGMLARVKIPIMGGKDALRVRAASIAESGIDGGLYVWIVGEDSRVSRRAVECGEITCEGVEILSGLEQGEVVVEQGGSKLYDGASVRVVNN